MQTKQRLDQPRPVYLVPDYSPWERMNMRATKNRGQRERRLALLFLAEEAGFTHARIGTREMRIGTAIKRVRREASIQEDSEACLLALELRPMLLRQALQTFTEADSVASSPCPDGPGDRPRWGVTRREPEEKR